MRSLVRYQLPTLRLSAPGWIRTSGQETLHFSCSTTELQARIVGLRGIEPPDLLRDASAAKVLCL